MGDETRSDRLISTDAALVMRRIEELQAIVVEQTVAVDERPPQVAREEAEARAAAELDAAYALLSRTPMEGKARNQRRWADPVPEGEPCPVCGVTSGSHGPLPHAVADERQADGYVPCGCDAAQVGSCVRQQGHTGTCVVEDGSGVPGIVAFTCRADDAPAHAKTAQAV